MKSKQIPARQRKTFDRFENRLLDRLLTPIFSEKHWHHYIPRCYQRAFCVIGSQTEVLCYDKADGTITLQGISNILAEQDLYLNGGVLSSGDTRVEEAFGIVEDMAAHVIRRATDDPTTFSSTVSYLDKRYLALFLASILARAPDMRRAMAIAFKQFRGLDDNAWWSLVNRYLPLCVDVPFDLSELCSRSEVDFSAVPEWHSTIIEALVPLAKGLLEPKWTFFIATPGPHSLILPDVPLLQLGNKRAVLPGFVPLAPAVGLVLGCEIGPDCVEVESVENAELPEVNQMLAAQCVRRYAIGASLPVLKAAFPGADASRLPGAAA